MGPLLVWVLSGCACLTSASPLAEDDALAERDRLLAQAERSVAEAGRKLKNDPTRPIVHLLPPGNWMNDPNGPIRFNGAYHMFYQLNPYGDNWGNMHWGHFRSDDLVFWKDDPIALWPSKSRGEEHCFSGAAVVRPDGKLMIFYTSIGKRDPEQWAAVSEDADARTFRKHPANPLLTLKDHGGLKIDDWRDPYVFREGSKWYMVVGGHRAGGKGCILLYQSGDLDHWTFRGIAHEGTENNWECPNLIRIGEKWVLIYSPHGPVRYKTGTLDLSAGRFVPEHEGVVDVGDYYAPNGLYDAQGRHLLWGWIRGFPEGKGWNGCLTLPRVLGVTASGRLTQQPLPELKALREAQSSSAKASVENGHAVVGTGHESTWEVELTITRKSAKQVVIKLLAEGRPTPLLDFTWQGDDLRVGESKLPPPSPGSRTLGLKIFRDRSVVEVYTEDGGCVARVVADADRPWDLWLEAEGGGADLQLERWPLRTIWKGR